MSLVATARLTAVRSQRTFDALLRALAEPGTIRHLPADVLDPSIPTPCWLALALADVGVAVSVDGRPEHPMARLIADATGATITDLDHAWIAVLLDARPVDIERLPLGTALAPEDGARVALGVTGFDPADPTEPTVHLRLTGPGIDGERHLAVAGLAPDLLDAVVAANVAFPAGIDVWMFTPHGEVCAIPRSTRITIEGKQ